MVYFKHAYVTLQETPKRVFPYTQNRKAIVHCLTQWEPCHHVVTRGLAVPECTWWVCVELEVRKLVCWRMVRSISMFSGGGGELRRGEEKGRRGEGEGEGRGRINVRQTAQFSYVWIWKSLYKRNTELHTYCMYRCTYVCIMCVCTVHMYMFA